MRRYDMTVIADVRSRMSTPSHQSGAQIPRELGHYPLGPAARYRLPLHAPRMPQPNHGAAFG